MGYQGAKFAPFVGSQLENLTSRRTAQNMFKIQVRAADAAACFRVLRSIAGRVLAHRDRKSVV